MTLESPRRSNRTRRQQSDRGKGELERRSTPARVPRFVIASLSVFLPVFVTSCGGGGGSAPPPPPSPDFSSVFLHRLMPFPYSRVQLAEPPQSR